MRPDSLLGCHPAPPAAGADVARTLSGAKRRALLLVLRCSFDHARCLSSPLLLATYLPASVYAEHRSTRFPLFAEAHQYPPL